MQRILRSCALAGATAALLAGCASTYRLDSTVQSHSGLPSLPPNPTYRFERLPSQAQSADQAQVESLADPALFKAGLRRDDANPRYSVQVGARVQRAISPWAADPWGWGWGGFWGPRWGWGPPVPTAANTYYAREVSVLVRELSSNRVVYESRAVSDSYYLNNLEVLTAMFDAALAGFPNPPNGVRRVAVQIDGRQPAGAAPAAAPAAPAAPASAAQPAR